MIIDFHTHIFPDRLANTTISLLSEKGGIPPFSDGTVDGLLDRMAEASADICVTLPVLTSPAQFDSVNRFAREINERFENSEKRLISFAGIHPACEDIEQKMTFIKESGFLGVKIHPDYQGTFIDDDGYVRIVQEAARLDLVVVTHSGVDGAYRDMPVRCTPKRAAELLKKAPHSKLVFAHCGANEMFDEVLDTLCGADVYFDTAYVLRFVGKDTFCKIVERHGADRILFASDSPWSDIRTDVEIINSFELDENTKKKIFCENARALLGI